MGQKLAAYDDAGTITAFYDDVDSPPPDDVAVIDITDDEWQAAISTPGHTVKKGKLVPPSAADLLARARDTAVGQLATACQVAIQSGFSSTALGPARRYPSYLQDQINQMAVATHGDGGVLWCAAGSTWALTAHTQEQAAQVVADFAEWLNACQQQLVDLSAKVAKATTTAAIQAVTWKDPA